MATAEAIAAAEAKRAAILAEAAKKDAERKAAAEAEHALAATMRADAAKKVGSGSTVQTTTSNKGPTYGRVSDPDLPLDIPITVEQPVDLPPETRSNGLLIVGAILAALYFASKVK